MARLTLVCPITLALALGGCVNDESGEVSSGRQAVTSAVDSELIDCAAEYANHGGTADEGRTVSWKYNNYQDSSGSESLSCTYGWCGPNSSIAGTRGGCVAGDDLETAHGYLYGACNSSAWGQRFRARILESSGGVDGQFCGSSGDPAKCTGTTTFGYHPYWEIDYNGVRRTYQGWSYETHHSNSATFSTGSGDTSCPDAGKSIATALTLGNITSAAGDQTFTFTVPAGSFGAVVKTTGATGDADLYVKMGSAPTLNNYDCRSWNGGVADETCGAFGSGTVYILIHPYNDFANLTLTGTYDSYTDLSGGGGGGGCTSSCTGEMCGQDDGGGNACPSTDANTCGMCGNSACGGGGTCTSVNENGLSGSGGTEHRYTITGTGVAVVLAGGSGDADLYVRLDAAPTTSTYDCRSNGYSNSESCNLSGSGTWHIMVRGYSTFSGADLTANVTSCSGGGSCTPVCSGDQCGQDDGCGGTCGATDANTCGMCGNAACGSCQPVNDSGLSGSGGTEFHYTITGTDVAAALSGGTGDADLYVRLGAEPTTSTYDCRSNGYTNSEACNANGTGTWHIMVRGYGSFSGADFTADVASCN